MKKTIALLFAGFLAGTSFVSGQSFSNSPTRSFGESSRTENSDRFNPIVWLRNYDEAVRLSQESSKPVVILFTAARTCPACTILERDVLRNPQFHSALKDKFIFLKAEFPDLTENSVSASPYKSLMDRYGVRAFPQMIVIDANGNRLFDVNYQQDGLPGYLRAFQNGRT